MEFTITEFSKYVEPGAEKHYHQFYKQTVKKYDAIKLHADGDEPGELITKRRPSESKKIQDYRKEIDEPITKATFDKVLNSLSKIRKSQDWSIRVDEQKVSSLIKEGERMMDYLLEKFPKYTSITNWYFQLGLKTQLVDTNAKVFVKPITFEVKDNEYLEPYPFIYNSPNVIDYKTGEYYVLKSDEVIKFVQQNQTYNGDRYYVVTDTNIQIFDQYSTDKKFRESFNYTHGLGHVPVYDFKGSVRKELLSQTLYESRIIGMVPFLNEARREYSDMQAEVVQHMHSTLWAYQPHDCKKCQGTGYLKKEKGTPTAPICTTCNGKGVYPYNPYENLILGKPPAGETNLPSPPAGFITKSIEIAKLQYERIENHKYLALSAINYEFLMTVPLSQSGVSKEWDREESENFTHSVAEDGVELLDNICYCTANYRYLKVLPDEKKRFEQVPVINVPQKYDLVNDAFLLDGIKAMKESKVDPAIVNAAEIEFAAKRFNTDLKVKEMVSLKLALDPFAGQPEDVVNSRSAFELIKKTDAIIHANIHSFIERAMEENKNFPEMPKKKQLEILLKYAEELIDEQPELQELDENGNQINPDTDIAGSTINEDRLGKLPLAVQQMSLAITRLQEAGLNDSANRLKQKLDEIVKEIDLIDQ